MEQVNLPKHICLSIQHNPHKGDYRSVQDWLDALEAQGMDYALLDEDRAEMLRTGEIWTMSWCPDTPVGSCDVYAATLERLFELANR